MAAALPQLEYGSKHTPGLGDTWKTKFGYPRKWDTSKRLHLEVASGMLRLFRTSDHLEDAAADRALAGSNPRLDVQLEAAAYRESMALLTNGDLGFMGASKVKTSSDRRITSWTRRSRSRMQQQLNRLDFTPLFEDGLEPAMVTLTMPGEWEDLAPTPAAFKKIVDNFTRMYAQAWGGRIRAVWKLEFQRRGAPHLHILMTPPAGTAGRLQLEFGDWLQRAWPQAVGAVGEQRVKHERAHAPRYTIDYVGEQYRDPRRIAAYFGKHGFFAAKDYQNRVPQIWLDAIAAGATGARFWGVWGLEKASAVVLLDETGSATVETLLDPLGVVRGTVTVVSRIISETEEAAEAATGATDATVMRAVQRAIDEQGSRSSDAVKVERHMRKLSRSLAMRGRLERNKHGDLVIPHEQIRVIRFERVDPATGEVKRCKSYRIGYYHGGSGFVLVNDGRRAGLDVLRILGSRSQWVAAA